MPAVIEVRNASRHYTQGEIQVHALDRVNLTIQKGEFVAIVGPSGSGKSTLLHLMGGLDTPSTGEIVLSGTPIQEMSGGQLCDFRRDHIGFIFQSYNLIPVLSAAENVEYVLTLQGIGSQVRRQRALDVLQKVGLEGFADRRPTQLSGGQQQRVAVARSLVSKPDIILADEPTANLDSEAGGALLDLMKQLNQEESTTFIFSTHDPMIMERARRLIRLKDGMLDSDETR